ncbi:unnamed protein product [Chrysoparadoxa australica]
MDIALAGAQDATQGFYVHLFSCSHDGDLYWQLYLDWLLLVLFSGVVAAAEASRVVLHRCCSSEQCVLTAPQVAHNSLVAINAHSHPRIEIGAYRDSISWDDGRWVGLIHLNHEQPWQQTPTAGHPGNMYDDLSSDYEGWSKVWRNYYFSPLTPTSTYLPLGPTYLRMYRSPATWEMTLASERSRLCHFQGRASGVDEREKLQSIIKKGDIPCTFEVSIDDSRDRFITTLRDTAFTLCPGGNSPETFRLWESLEAGSIPVSFLPLDAARNFFTQLGPDCPLPFLEDPQELDEFLQSFKGKEGKAKMDELQQDTQQWYRAYLLEVAKAVSVGWGGVVEDPSNFQRLGRN